MRLVRLAALLGSLMLLAVTTVSIINGRAEARSNQVSRVESSADIMNAAVRENVAATKRAIEIATVGAAAPDVERSLLADEIGSMFEGAQACVGTTVAECTGPDLLSLAQVGALTADTGDDAIAAVDASTDSVLFVHRATTSGVDATVVIQVPKDALVSEPTREIIRAAEVEPALEASSQRMNDERSSAVVIDGERTVEATIGSVFLDGSLTVRTTTDSSIPFIGNRPGFYSTLLILGTVLLTLAAVTFFRDRRSLEKQATTDDLTGLVNRREFEHMAEEALDIAGRFGTGLCVMVIDLNGFKQVNDTLGHQFGDLVLKASAERLTDAVRDTDVVGRWGGDEFVIMLPGLHDRTGVRNSAERISETLSGSPVVGDTLMTASIGAAIFPRHGETLDELMRAADMAMYGAKTTGVGYRIADTITARHDLFGGSAEDPTIEAPAGRTIATNAYVGPDRRLGDPLPPPQTDPTDEHEREHERADR